MKLRRLVVPTILVLVVLGIIGSIYMLLTETFQSSMTVVVVFSLCTVLGIGLLVGRRSSRTSSTPYW